MTSRKTTAAGRKEFGQHDTLAALTAGLAQRYEPPSAPGSAAAGAGQGESDVVAASVQSEQTPSAALSRRPDGMVIRSWYLSAGTVDALNSAVNDMFHDLRGTVPKYVIIAELVAAGIAQSADVRATLQKAQQE